MEIRNNLEGTNALQNLTPVSQPAVGQPASPTTSAPAAQPATLGGDHATVSSVASGVAQIASTDEVRMDKVASIHAALVNGTYDVSPKAVASKLVDSMLGGK